MLTQNIVLNNLYITVETFIDYRTPIKIVKAINIYAIKIRRKKKGETFSNSAESKKQFLKNATPF